MSKRVTIKEYRINNGYGSEYVKEWTTDNGDRIAARMYRHNDEWWKVVVVRERGEEVIASRQAGPWGIPTLADARRARSELVAELGEG